MMNKVILHSSSQDELKKLIVEAVREEITPLLTKEDEPDNRLLTRKEVAEMLGVSLPTLDKWTKEGTIPAVRIGKGHSVRYRMLDIKAAQREVKSIKYLRRREVL